MQVVALNEVVEILRNGASIKQSKSAGGTPITRIETIADWNINPLRCGYADISENDFPNHLMQDGDILISHINSTKHLGKCAIYRGVPEKLIHGMNLLGLRVNSDIACSNYIYRVLCSPEFRLQLPKITKNSVNQSSFTVPNFRALKIPLPPLEEQKRIAAILDKADAVYRKRQQAIDLTDQLLRSVFLDMFGDLNKFPMVQIKEIAAKTKYSLSSGPFGSNLTSKHYESYGVIVLRGTNVTSGQLNLDNVKYVSEEKAEELKRSKVCPDDIVIIAVGSSGHAFKIPKSLTRAVMSQNFNKVTPDKEKVTPTYLEYCFNSPLVQRQFKQNITDTVRAFLSLTKIKEVKIPLPPLERQVQFESIVNQIHTNRTKLENTRQESEILFESLTQQAFRGELIKQTEVA